MRRTIQWLLAVCGICTGGWSFGQQNTEFSVYQYIYTNYIYETAPREDVKKLAYSDIRYTSRAWYVYYQTQMKPIQCDSFYLYVKGNQVWQGHHYHNDFKLMDASTLLVGKDTLRANSLHKKGDKLYLNDAPIFSWNDPIKRAPAFDLWEQETQGKQPAALVYQGTRQIRDANKQLFHCDLFMHEWTKQECQGLKGNADTEWKVMSETYLDKETALPVLKNYYAYWCYTNSEKTALLASYRRRTIQQAKGTSKN